MKTECPNPRPDCKYYDKGCFSDTDHIVPRRLGKCALSKAYINLPENKQQMCRSEHDEKSKQGDEPLPTRTEMRQAVLAAHILGTIQLSNGNRKRMK